MKTLFVGQNRIHLMSVPSTNSYATELLRQSKPIEGTLIYSFNQENGKGQRGNKWESEANKNIALSLVLTPSFLDLKCQFLLSKIVALSLTDLLSEELPRIDRRQLIKIKWPNDIYVNDKKIAGVLIENGLQKNNILNSIVGIGLNVNQTVFKQVSNATSLALLDNRVFDLIRIINRWCEFFEPYYLKLKANTINTINFSYLNQMYQLNEWKNYTYNNEVFKGKIIGVSEIGKLRIELFSGLIKEFDLKEINYF